MQVEMKSMHPVRYGTCPNPGPSPEGVEATGKHSRHLCVRSCGHSHHSPEAEEDQSKNVEEQIPGVRVRVCVYACAYAHLWTPQTLPVVFQLDSRAL